MAPARAASKKGPHLVEMPTQKMAVIYTKGDPTTVAPQALPHLYGSVYTLRFDLKKKGGDFKVSGLRARWPNAHLAPKNDWIGIWGLPIPDDTTALPQKDPGVEVKIEVWEYGTAAQVLHIGPYETEMPAVERLHRFIAESGYEIAGDHEEEYLTSPRAKVQKTLIRYPVRRK
ncbi:MAG: GyrI-like domain-containing protein [Chloroflexi bacterium]|nr:GyrI-like domain-containing protein [Chloroflexota bacterium]